jgi:RNA polymerase sporulation-specific sigma factor
MYSYHLAKARIDSSMNDETAVLEQWTPLVYSVLRRRFGFMIREARTSGKGAFGIDEDDLLQEGKLALLKAAKYYKSEFGVSFKTYAFRAIENEMRYVFSKYSTPLTTSGRSPAQAKREDTKQKILNASESFRMDDFSEKNVKRRDALVHKVKRTHEEIVDGTEHARYCLKKIVQIVSNEERSLLEMHLNGMTFKKIGKSMKISSQRAHQKYRKLVGKLRKHLGVEADLLHA